MHRVEQNSTVRHSPFKHRCSYRFGAVSQEWVARPERSNVWAIRFIAWFALTFGRRASRILLYPICIYFMVFSVKARSASRKYLDRALARKSTMIDGFRHCFYFASTILDRVFLLNNQISAFDIRTHGEEIFREIRAGGKGCLLIGAHMGSFEVIHALSREHDHPRTSLVMYEDNARKLNSVLDNINPLHNRPVIPLGKIDSMLRIQEALQRGEYIGILADRTISGSKTISCERLSVRSVIFRHVAGLTSIPSDVSRLSVGLIVSATRSPTWICSIGFVLAGGATPAWTSPGVSCVR